MKELDLLGDIITFHTSNSQTTKSKLGGLITIIISVLLILTILGFGQDFFKRKNPSIVLSTEDPEIYPVFTIDKKSFSFAFRIEDFNGNFLNRTDLLYATITRSYLKKDKNGIWERTEKSIINTPLCSQEEIADSRYPVNELLCPELDGINMGGFWDGNFLSRIDIEVFQCLEGQFNLQGKPCGSNAERESLLKTKKIFLSMYYQKIIVNSHNYSNGLIASIINNYYTLDEEIFKNPLFFFSETVLKTDYGWLVTDIKEERMLGIRNFYFDINSVSIDPLSIKSSLTRAGFFFIKEKSEYTREYQKAQTLAAQVGGILKVFIILGKFITINYNLCLTKLNLAHLLFFNQKRDNIDALNKLDNCNNSKFYNSISKFNSDNNNAVVNNNKNKNLKTAELNRISNPIVSKLLKLKFIGS